MSATIYIISIILFLVLFAWTWTNAKEFNNNKQKIIFILMGIIILTVITFIIFSISKIGISYPEQNMIKQIRKVVMLIFIPINGFLCLPHLANIKTEIELDTNNQQKNKKKIIILGIIFIIAIILETIYLKDFQKGVIQILNNK